MFLARIEQRQDWEDRRRSPRRSLNLAPNVSNPGGQFDAVVHDLSRTGLVLETAADLAVGETIHIDLPRHGRTAAAVVWRREFRIGCEFHNPIPASAMSAALLRSRPNDAGIDVENQAGAAPDSIDEASLSPGQKLMVLVSLSTLLWLVIIGVGIKAFT